MDELKSFSKPRLSVDKATLMIDFLPLYDNEQAFHWLKKIGFSERYEIDYSINDRDDWCDEACLFLTDFFDLREELSGNTEFRASSNYNCVAQLPIGINLQFSRPKQSKLIAKHELYGPYREGEKVRYAKEYEKYDCKGQIRIEWNPNNTDITILKDFFFYISRALAFNPLENLRFTRIDWAVDQPSALELLLISNKKNNVIGRTLVSQSGSMTREFGSRNSDKFIRIYDKKGQLKDVKKLVHENKHYFRIEGQNGKGFLISEDEEAKENLFQDLVMGENSILTNNTETSSAYDDLILAYHSLAISSGLAFADVAKKMLKNNSQKKKRLMRRFRSFILSNPIHPAKVFDDLKDDIWATFKNNLLSCFE